MALATKSKNIRESRLFKTVCALLSVLLAFVFVSSAIDCIIRFESYGANNFFRDNSIQEMRSFYMDLESDINSISSVINHKQFEKNYIKYKKAVVDDGMQKFRIAKNFYNDRMDEFGYGEPDLSGSYFDSKTATYYENMYSLIDSYNGLYTFSYASDLEELPYYNGAIHLDCPIYYDEDSARAEIESDFDRLSNGDDNYKPDELMDLKNLKFYAVGTDGTVFSNVDKDEQEKLIYDFTNNCMYYISINEKREINTNLQDGFPSSGFKELYLQIDDFAGTDKYESYFELYSWLSNQNYALNFSVMVFSALALIIIMIILCSCAGYNNGERTISLIDKVPNDIHIIVSGAAIIGLCLFVICAAQNYLYDVIKDISGINSYSPILIPTMSIAAAGAYLLFAEWMTSLCRQIKAHRNVFKNTFVYIASRWIGKLIKKCFNPVKQMLSYKLKTFKKQLIAWLIAYGAVNFLLFLCITVSLMADFEALALFFSLIVFAVNVVSVVFVSRYAVLLDKIIVAMHNHTMPELDYYKLPQSLKVLVDSMHYTNQELNSAVEKAVKDERMRTELITNVSHDLKTPLTSIINYVDLLKQCDISDDNALEYIDVLEDKGAKLKRLIDDLIEASKVTSGVINLNPVSFDLSELSTEAIVEHQQEFVDNGLELIFKGDAHNVIAFADGNKTYRVIQNLISNARKYSARGSRVYADVFEQNNTAIFEIKNISAEPLDISPDELTERFVRGDKSRNAEGNGLGLSIADNLCKAMGGKLEIIIDGDLFKARVVLPKNNS